jgi:hypothetical protein
MIFWQIYFMVYFFIYIVKNINLAFRIPGFQCKCGIYIYNVFMHTTNTQTYFKFLLKKNKYSKFKKNVL